MMAELTVRQQVQLTDGQARELREAATEYGISMAELIRRALDREIAERHEKDAWARASALVGRYHGTPPDLAINHDRYLADAYLPDE